MGSEKEREERVSERERRRILVEESNGGKGRGK